MAGNPVASQRSPSGNPRPSKERGSPAWAKPIIGTVRAGPRTAAPIRATNWSTVVLVAARHFATDSVDGQRCRWSGVTRLDLLKVVGSRPARLARPEGEVPARAASASMASQICVWVSMADGAGVDMADLGGGAGAPGSRRRGRGCHVPDLGIITLIKAPRQQRPVAS